MFGLWGSSAPEVPNYPELPTPASDADYNTVSSDAQKKCLELLSTKDGWEVAESPVADVELLLKTMGDSPAKISRAEGVIELPMGQLLKVIDSTDPESWKAQEDDLADWKIVKKLAGEEHYLVYSAHKTPYPISHRELLYVRSRHVLEDGRVMIVGSSVNDKEQPVQESRVRAAVLACWVMKAIDANKTNVIRMIQLDPKGNIPSFLVNTHNAKTAKALGVITEAAKK